MTNLKDKDLGLALMCGIDIPIPELQIIIHQPTIKEISYIGERQFYLGVQSLVVDKNMITVEDNSVLENITNFQIFMTIMQDQSTKDKKQAVRQVLQLICPTRQVVFTPNSIILNDSATQQQSLIDVNNFEIFQDYIKEVFCLSSELSDQRTFNPKGERAKEIAQKLMRGRQRVAAQKGDTAGGIFGRYASILTIGINSMSLLEVLSLTIYQVYDLISRYALYINWDLDIRSRLAGAKQDKPPEDWMKNIH